MVFSVVMCTVANVAYDALVVIFLAAALTFTVIIKNSHFNDPFIFLI